MLNSNLKEKVLDDYKQTQNEYSVFHEELIRNLQGLYNRRVLCVDLVSDVEKLVNSIANHPKHYEVTVRKIQAEKKAFHRAEEYGKEAGRTAARAGIGMVSGVAGGTAIAAAAPAAAVWAATTFGTASTGTAISSLSGAAATKAALACLGGGALSAGGAGVAGGEAVLSLAGPVGWIIAGGTVIVSASVVSCKNKEIAHKAASDIKKIKWETARVREIILKVRSLSAETIQYYGELRKQYLALARYSGRDFREFEQEIKDRFHIMIINTAVSMAEMLNRKVC